MDILKEIKKEYIDIDDFEDNLEFYRNLMNLREFEVIFKHEKLLESEFLLFLSHDLPEFIPFFYYINWKTIEAYKADINNCKLIHLKNLDITQKTIKEINSIFQNNSEQSSINYMNQSDDSINLSLLKESINKSMSKDNSILEKEIKLDDGDLKLKDTIKTVKYDPYVGDNKVIGSLFEGDIINYVYDQAKLI